MKLNVHHLRYKSSEVLAVVPYMNAVLSHTLLEPEVSEICIDGHIVHDPLSYTEADISELYVPVDSVILIPEFAVCTLKTFELSYALKLFPDISIRCHVVHVRIVPPFIVISVPSYVM